MIEEAASPIEKPTRKKRPPRTKAARDTSPLDTEIKKPDLLGA
jgi:hypothetical protein